MVLTWRMKRGDTYPPLKVQLLRGGVPIDLTGATVNFCFLGNKYQCTVTDAANGKIEHQWQPEETSNPGTYNAEIEVTYSSGSVETFPNNDYIKIIILDDIA